MWRKKRLQQSLQINHKTLSFWKRYILDWIMDITIAGIIVYIVTTFAFQNMYVVGGSMIPTLHNGEAVLVNKLIYNMKAPNRYDIVAFKYNDGSNNEINLVKRVVGVPGDKIEIYDNKIYVNEALIYPMIDKDLDRGIIIDGNMSYPIIVPQEAYFVLGDNVGNSIDSRYQQVGIIPQKELMGKIVIRLWPIWKLKIF